MLWLMFPLCATALPPLVRSCWQEVLPEVPACPCGSCGILTTSADPSASGVCRIGTGWENQACPPASLPALDRLPAQLSWAAD
jgi:hypothetical protein